MKSIKSFIIAIAIPLGVGGLSAFLTRGNMSEFELINKPPLTPPAILFPIVWSILYILMGIASYLVYVSDSTREAKKTALTIYGIQLGFNFFWSILFFNFKLYFISFAWLFVMWLLIIMTTLIFRAVSGRASYLMVPYILWVTFAGYLNFYIFLAN